MNLTKEQQEIYDGKQGATLAKVMQTLVRYGELFGADGMVPQTGIAVKTLRTEDLAVEELREQLRMGDRREQLRLIACGETTLTGAGSRQLPLYRPL